ncbi:mariner Mos1 transposase [Trichonephila clavipes]|nr:mariner Mos1 transposase [Trichonephila clavipes]
MKFSRLFKRKRALYYSKHDKIPASNARPQVLAQVPTYLETFTWEVLLHPLYSPDISPSDYHLFRSLTHGLFRQLFTPYEDSKNCVDSWIASKDEAFLRRGIRIRPERRGKLMANDGQYFE